MNTSTGDSDLTTDRARARLRSDVPTMPPRMFCMLSATALKPISFPSALTKKVLPVPGGPTKITPWGMSRRRFSRTGRMISASRPCLELLHAADDLEAVGWVHHFEQTGVFLGDEGGLLGAHQVAGERCQPGQL